MGKDGNSFDSARRALVQRLESLQRAGVLQLPRCQGQVAPLEPPTAPPALAPAAYAPPEAASYSPPPVVSTTEELMPRKKAAATVGMELPTVSVLHEPYPSDSPRTTGDKQHDFALVADIVARCTLCKELAATRKQTVFGVGNVNARVAFFGEAPGADEDRQGEPFVGRAGQLLTKIIEACGWTRDDVYILNVLKCRPPDNRTPLPFEVENCRQYFQRQFEVIRPEYIVCVGAVSAQALLETTEAVGKLRGRFHRYRDSKVLVTYHPSYLLRNPAAKKYVWDDMQILLKEMGLPIPGKKG